MHDYCFHFLIVLKVLIFPLFCRIYYEPPYLNIGDGITYRIPPSYDRLAASLNLPGFSDMHVEEVYLKGTLDLGSLAAMIANDKRLWFSGALAAHYDGGLRM